jgi:hypothetical protein
VIEEDFCLKSEGLVRMDGHPGINLAFAKREGSLSCEQRKLADDFGESMPRGDEYGRVW